MSSDWPGGMMMMSLILCCRIDVAEAHYAQITVLCISGVVGTAFWSNLFPGLDLQMKVSR